MYAGVVDLFLKLSIWMRLNGCI